MREKPKSKKRFRVIWSVFCSWCIKENMVHVFKLVIACVLGLFVNRAQGQKELQYTIHAEDLEGIVIESDQIFELFVKTVPGDVMRVAAEVEGETFESVLLECVVKENTWYVTTKRSLTFENIDDKLAAHKVISIVLFVEIPEAKNLVVTSGLASVKAEGNYNRVMMNLSGGGCVLKNFKGNGIINTLRGNIEVTTQDAQIHAQTRNGKIEVQNNTQGRYELTLKSIDGTIRVKQSE